MPPNSQSDSSLNANYSILLNDVGKNFSSKVPLPPALSHITTRIKRGCITGLVGPDGAGKTTLMRIIAGLLLPTQGHLSIEGLDPSSNTNALHAVLGYMPQKFGLYEDLTVIENLNLYADLRGVLGDERCKTFEQLLNFTDLNRFTTRPAGKLSGGMKQKLGLACVLLGRPRILLLDEPSVGVDPISRRELWKMVNTLITDGITVIWSTSYLDEAELCNEVLLMNAGNLIYSGPPETLTIKIAERSMQIRQITGNHRQVLQRALRAQEVIDGVIQGKNVRLLLKEEKKLPDLASLKAGQNAELVHVKPRFEDAFIDILGGGPGGDSVLAKIMNPVPLIPQPDTVITATALTKIFGTFTATDNISFTIKQGEIFGLLGPNGAGKSTTFKMLCGLLAPTSGTAQVLGLNLYPSNRSTMDEIQTSDSHGMITNRLLSKLADVREVGGGWSRTAAAYIDVREDSSTIPSNKFPTAVEFQKKSDASQARQNLGYMAQKFSLYNDLTVQQNLQFFSGIYGLDKKRQAEKIAEMVDVFDFKPFLNITTANLALGFKQRLALACAIMHEPVILFLDEPTSGVDPITRREFWVHINGLVEKGMTIVVSTHFMDEAEYCDRIGLIYRGKLIVTGTPDQLKASVTSEKNPDPTMEDTFIDLIIEDDKKNKINTSPVSFATTIKNKKSFTTQHDSIRRWLALCRKEFYQIVRDPSSILIAFVLPMVMLFIYGFGLNLDTSKIRLGIVMDDTSLEAQHFENTFSGSPFIVAIPLATRHDAERELKKGNIRGFITIQSDFSMLLKNTNGIAPVQIITDGSEPNTASFVIAYATGAWQAWQRSRSLETGKPTYNAISLEPRFWFNPAAISRYFLIPGSIAVIMTVIGALLTSLVVAREWERGTMEALLSTPVTRLELFFSKLVPYYLLGIGSMGLCLLVAVTILKTPFRGSLLLLFIQTSLFLGSALGLGLLLSTTTRNQFNAAQAALNIAFLPAVMLSGFVYEISSMPIVVQGITYLFPARYFVASLQTLFLAGNIGLLLFQDALFLLASAVIFLGLTARFTRRRLE